MGPDSLDIKLGKDVQVSSSSLSHIMFVQIDMLERPDSDPAQYLGT